MSGQVWGPATPKCEHWGHKPGEWFYACCACSGMPAGCDHCATDWDGQMVHPDGLPEPATRDLPETSED